jgi:hypothetical protein
MTTLFFVGIQIMEMPSSQVVSREDEIRLCLRDGVNNGRKWC